MPFFGGGGNTTTGAPNYGPNPGLSGNDPRGRLQNQSQYQQQRYESQQGPLMAQAGLNYARGSEADYGNYNDIMNMYRGIASGSDGSGGGGGGVDYGAGQYTPFTVDYSDPFASYGGFQDFSNTGGYSAADMANLRARGVSPIRAAYANAEQNLQRGRSLQGGYSPNMAASQVKMAREQGQSAADATQNVEAGIIANRNQGKLAGLTGMSGIEGQRLGAQIDVGKFNAGQMSDAQARNIGAAAASSASSAAASRAAMGDRMDALQGMRLMYGTTPGMTSNFGNQAMGFLNSGSQFGNQLYGNDINAATRPGAFDQTVGRINQIGNYVGTGLSIYDDYRRRQQQNNGATRTNTPPVINDYGDMGGTE